MSTMLFDYSVLFYNLNFAIPRCEPPEPPFLSHQWLRTPARGQILLNSDLRYWRCKSPKRKRNHIKGKHKTKRSKCSVHNSIVNQS